MESIPGPSHIPMDKEDISAAVCYFEDKTFSVINKFLMTIT